jgi:hypothetical protein
MWQRARGFDRRNMFGLIKIRDRCHFSIQYLGEHHDRGSAVERRTCLQNAQQTLLTGTHM